MVCLIVFFPPAEPALRSVPWIRPLQAAFRGDASRCCSRATGHGKAITATSIPQVGRLAYVTVGLRGLTAIAFLSATLAMSLQRSCAGLPSRAIHRNPCHIGCNRIVFRSLLQGHERGTDQRCLAGATLPTAGSVVWEQLIQIDTGAVFFWMLNHPWVTLCSALASLWVVPAVTRVRSEKQVPPEKQVPHGARNLKTAQRPVLRVSYNSYRYV